MLLSRVTRVHGPCSELGAHLGLKAPAAMPRVRHPAADHLLFKMTHEVD